MARDRERRGKDSKAADRRRTPKKKVSILNQDSIDWVDYKDVNLLRRFMSERAKIRARRVTGNNAQQQREVARAIRVAREMALLPYSVRQVTQRSRSGRRDRGDRADLSAPMPTPDAPPPVVSELDELPEGVTVEVVEETVAVAVAAPETGGEEAAAPEAGATDPGADE
jgi:small subunit ribosomal protein S18